MRGPSQMMSFWMALNSGLPARSSSSKSAASTVVTTAPARSIRSRPRRWSTVARAGGVGGHVDLDAIGEQVVDGLADADVGLDPADDGLVARRRARTPRRGRRRRRSSRWRLVLEARPRARCGRGLWGTARSRGGQLENPRALEQGGACVGDCGKAPVGAKALLHVDDEQRRRGHARAGPSGAPRRRGRACGRRPLRRRA